MSGLNGRVTRLEAHHQPIESGDDISPSWVLLQAIGMPDVWAQMVEAYHHRHIVQYPSQQAIEAELAKWQRRDFGIGYGATSYNPRDEHVYQRNIIELQKHLIQWDSIEAHWQALEALRFSGDIETFVQAIQVTPGAYSFRDTMRHVLLYWRDKHPVHGQLSDMLLPVTIGMMFVFDCIHADQYPDDFKRWKATYEQLK